MEKPVKVEVGQRWEIVGNGQVSTVTGVQRDPNGFRDVATFENGWTGWSDVMLGSGGRKGEWAHIAPEAPPMGVPAPAKGQRWADSFIRGGLWTLGERSEDGWAVVERPGASLADRFFTDGRLTYVDTPRLAPPESVPGVQVGQRRRWTIGDCSLFEVTEREGMNFWIKYADGGVYAYEGPWIADKSTLLDASPRSVPQELTGERGEIGASGEAASVVPEKRAHDWSNPYLVAFGSRMCVECGVAQECLSVRAAEPCKPDPQWRINFERDIAERMARRSTEKREARKESPFQQSHLLGQGAIGIWSLREEER